MQIFERKKCKGSLISGGNRVPKMCNFSKSKKTAEIEKNRREKQQHKKKPQFLNDPEKIALEIGSNQ